MFKCENNCGSTMNGTTYWSEPKTNCPICGGKVIEEPLSNKPIESGSQIYFHDRWPERNHVMDVGMDRKHCPTRQSYLDACKKARVMKPGKREWEYTEVIPAGVLDV